MHNKISQAISKQSVTSYILVFTLPFILITLLTHNINYAITSKEIREREKTYLALTLANSLEIFEDYTSIAQELPLSDVLIAANGKLPKDTVIDLMHTLTNYKNTKPYLLDMLVHFYGTSYGLTTDATILMEDFYTLHPVSSYSSESAYSLFHTIDTPTFIGSQTLSFAVSSPHVLLYMMPLKVEDKLVGSMLFYIDADVMAMPLEQSETNFSYFFNRHSLESQIEASTFSDHSNLSPDYLCSLLESLTPEEPVLQLDLDRYLLSATIPYEIDDNLVLVTLRSADEVYVALQFINAAMFTTCFIILILALLALLYVKYANSVSLDIFATPLSSDEDDDLDSDLAQTLPIRQLRQRLLLLELVNGQIHNFDNFLNTCTEMDLRLDAAFYNILIVNSTTSTVELEPSTLTSIQTLQSTTITSNYLLQHIYPTTAIYLLGTTSPCIIHSLDAPDASLYFGTSHEHLASIPKSYLSAMTLMDIDHLKKHQLLHLADLIPFYKSYTEQINKLLYSNTFEHVPREILLLVKDMETQDLPFLLRKSICTEVLSIFENFFTHHTSLNYECFDLLSFYRLKTYSELKEIFIEMTTEMTDILLTQSPHIDSTLTIDAITTYINVHLTNPDLIPQQIASYFHISNHHLETLIKTHLAMTADEYILQLRMDKAKHLLISTPYGLKLISEQTGFSHISSLISMFKHFYSLTPGQYREQYKESGSTTM